MRATAEAEVERRIGDMEGEVGGPLLVAVAGLHGNEPAGVYALYRVFERLQADRIPLRGRFVGMAGNTRALQHGVRFIDRDLNRAWTDARVSTTAGSGPLSRRQAEDVEQYELWSALIDLFDVHRGPVVCVDLHTTSASGGPFATMGDTLRNRAFAARFPVTKLLGIEEQIDGGLLGWVGDLGHITLGFEGGQHEDPASIDMHEAFIWQALEHSGVVAAEHVPDRLQMDVRLREASRGIPPIIEVRHRHPVVDGDGFRMEPGWQHFQRVERGQVLATDREGPIAAVESGFLLLPLYQGQGDDGFFLGREVRPIWLSVSRALRSSGAPDLAHWLPGVRRKPGDPSTVLVDAQVARWQPVGVFHLLGYRRVRRNGDQLEFTRRVE